MEAIQKKIAFFIPKSSNVCSSSLRIHDGPKKECQYYLASHALNAIISTSATSSSKFLSNMLLHIIPFWPDSVALTDSHSSTFISIKKLLSFLLFKFFISSRKSLNIYFKLFFQRATHNVKCTEYWRSNWQFCDVCALLSSGR